MITPRRKAVVHPGADALLALLFAPGLAAQITTPPEIPVDPDLPRKEGFDAERAFLGSQPIFTPLRDPDFESLRSALRRGDVAEDTPSSIATTGVAFWSTWTRVPARWRPTSPKPTGSSGTTACSG